MKQNRRIETGAVLILFSVFIMSTFAALALGVGAYGNIYEASERGRNERVGLSYVWTKIKSGEEAGHVRVGEFHGLPALFIDEQHGERLYRMAIYHHDGWIYELFFESGYDFEPRDGQAVVRNDSFSVAQLTGGLIRVMVGGESIFIYPRTG